jgi:cysteine desulfuration protein SufE
LTRASEEIIADFQFLEGSDRLQLLLEFSEALPELDARYGDHPELPVFIAVDGTAAEIKLHFSAPRESPTTRGFASILFSALSSHSADEILELSDDFPTKLGLDHIITPLRVRGMRGMLARIKRKTAELVAKDA